MAKAKSKGTQHKAMRPTWEGHLRLSLVTCPVALYTATERTADVHFNLINPKTNNRIRMQTVDAGTGEEVERADLVKGFEVAKNKYVLFDKDELDAVKLESTRIIDIEEFVDADTIDRIYWDEPYYLAPAGKTGIEAFAVIRAAMAKQNKVALGRLVLHSANACLRARAARQRHPAHHLAHPRRDPRHRARCSTATCPSPTRACCRSPRRSSSSRRPSSIRPDFKDRYEDALRDLIARKKKGEKLVTSEVPEEDDKVVDLMEALKKSLKGGGGPSRDKADRFLEAQARKAKPKKKASSRKRAFGHHDKASGFAN